MLVARYQQPMLRLARSMVSNQAVAEEAVQDTWMGVVRGIDRFEGRSSFKTWLFRILVNRARSAGAREPTDRPIEALHAVDPARFDATANGPIPSSAGPRRATTVSTPPPGRRSSSWPSTTCLPGSARSSCCATSKVSPTMKRAPCSASARQSADPAAPRTDAGFARCSSRDEEGLTMLSLRRRDIVCQQAVELVTDYLEVLSRAGIGADSKPISGLAPTVLPTWSRSG